MFPHTEISNGQGRDFFGFVRRRSEENATRDEHEQEHV